MSGAQTFSIYHLAANKKKVKKRVNSVRGRERQGACV